MYMLQMAMSKFDKDSNEKKAENLKIVRDQVRL